MGERGKAGKTQKQMWEVINKKRRKVEVNKEIGRVEWRRVSGKMERRRNSVDCGKEGSGNEEHRGI